MRRTKANRQRRRSSILAVVTMAGVAASDLSPIQWASQAQAASLYWDINGVTPGAGGATPAGTWGVDPNWNTVAAGTGTTTNWTNNNTAVFSAGSDATGAFTVTVTNTRTASGINVEEGDVTLTGGGLITPSIDVASGTSLTVNSVLGGTNGLTKTGGGTLTLGTSNTYTGNTTVSGGGTLRATGSATLSAGSLTITSGTVDLTSSSQSVSSLSLGDGIATASADVLGSGGALTINGDITYNSAPTNATAPALIGSGVNLSSGNHNITNVAGQVSTSAYDLVLSGPISGAGGFTMNGSGNFHVALSSSGGSYSGATIINSGTLVVGANNAISSSSAVTVAAGALLTTATTSQNGVVAGNYAQSIGSLNGGGNVFIGSAQLTVGSDNIGAGFSGTISGTGSLRKVGINVFELHGPNTYTGGTTVSSGYLAFSDGSSIIGPITNNGVVYFDGFTNYTFPNPISGSGTVLAQGPGTLILTGLNSYTGGTTLTGTIMQAAQGTTFPSAGTLTLSAGSVFESTSGSFTGNAVVGYGGFSALGPPLVVNNGHQLGFGTTLVLNDSAAVSSIEYHGYLATSSQSPSAIEVDANVATMMGEIDWSGVGFAVITKTGVGVLRLRNLFSSYPATIVVGGALDIDDEREAGNTISLVGTKLASGASFKYSRPLLLTGADTNTLDTQGFSPTFSGSISGTSLLTKVGAGTLFLRGTTSGYSRSFVIANGAINVSRAADFANAATPNILLNGGTFQAGASFVATNRTIALGQAGGTIDTNGYSPALTLADSANSGSLTEIGVGTLLVNSLNLPSVAGGVTINGGTIQILPNGQAAGVSRLRSLAVSAGGVLDLVNNHLILTAQPPGTWNGSNYTDVTGLIASGKNGFGWGGSGIVTSQTFATTGDYTGIGVARASDARPSTATATSTWAGQTITGTDTLVMYTYGGDANLDGKLNVDDYIRIDIGIASHFTGWTNGDFNYDGHVDIDDYTIIDANIGTQGAPFVTSSGAAAGAGAVSAVPEPVSVAGISLILIGAAAKRSRRVRR